MKYISPEERIGGEMLAGMSSDSRIQNSENEHYQRARKLIHLIRKQRGLG